MESSSGAGAVELMPPAPRHNRPERPRAPLPRGTGAHSRTIRRRHPPAPTVRSPARRALRFLHPRSRRTSRKRCGRRGGCGCVARRAAAGALGLGVCRRREVGPGKLPGPQNAFFLRAAGAPGGGRLARLPRWRGVPPNECRARLATGAFRSYRGFGACGAGAPRPRWARGVPGGPRDAGVRAAAQPAAQAHVRFARATRHPLEAGRDAAGGDPPNPRGARF